MINVPRETAELLSKYQNKLLFWNKKINLIAKSTESEIWNRHITDSMQLIQYIDKDSHIVDLGAGAGLPGVVLSICGVKNVTLIESNTKKCSFLFSIKNLSKEKINIINEQVDSNFVLECDILTCRAFSNILDILELTKNIVVNKKYLLLKGAKYQEEIEEARKKICFEYKIYDSITSNDGKIVEIYNVKHVL